MCGHIEFRHHADTPVARVFDHAADFLLGVEKAVRALFLQQGIFFTLDSKSLIVREVPVKDVQLNGLHAVERAIHHIQRHEMAAHVQHQSPPGKPGLIVNGHCRDGEASRGDLDQLEKGFEAVQHAQRIGGFEMNSIRCNLQVIGLIFIDLLDRRARPLGLDEEYWLVELGLAKERDSGLPREERQEALFGALQARLLETVERNAESAVDDKLARPRLHLRGQRH